MTSRLDHAAAARAVWAKCPGCGSLIYHKRLGRNLQVCPECDHHLRMDARERIALLVDPGSFQELYFAPESADPLVFTDVRDYTDRLADAARRSRESEATIVGTAQIGGRPAVLVVMDFEFLGGSMGLEVGRRVSEAAELALERRYPLIAVCASGGARMQEGVFSLLQMARTSQAFACLREDGLLSVCVLTDPTYGGVSASFANLGAVVVAERGAHLGFAGRRVVQETIRADLPAGFQTAEFLLQHGLVDRVEDRAELRPLLIQLVALHAIRSPQATGLRVVAEPPDTIGTDVLETDVIETDVISTDAISTDTTCTDDSPQHALDQAVPADRDCWEVVQTARSVDRPTTLDYLNLAFDDFVEMHGDRAHSDDPAIVGGVALLGGRAVVVIGNQKGHSVNELVARNFGMAHPEGYRKALRLMDHAETFGMPVVTFVDTPGAHPGPDAEERGQSIAIAQAIARSTRLRVPIVSVITGEGGSGGALALCTSDRLLVLENAFLSVISPEGCAAILWRTATSAPAAARALQLGAGHLKASGIATSVVPEPPGGAQCDPAACARTLRDALLADLEDLSDVEPQVLLANRRQRFSRLGGPMSMGRATSTSDRAG